MGDTSINTKEEPSIDQSKEPSTDAGPPIAPTSVEILRECKPSENISIHNSATSSNVEEEPPLESMQSIPIVKISSKIETVFEKLDINEKSDSNSDSTACTDGDKDSSTTVIDTPPLTFDIKEKASDRNRSDIFSLDEKIQNSNTIFSIKVWL